MKKLGIIGSGMVAKALAIGFIKHVYRVMLGSRDKAKREQLSDCACYGVFPECMRTDGILHSNSLNKYENCDY